MGCDGFHPKVPLAVKKETRGGIVECLEKVEQSGQWPQQACTTMFFLIPKNITSERPIALMPPLIRWWEALRAPEVAKWQQKYRVDWDATDCRNGGAQQTVWEILTEMERFDGKAKDEDQGAVVLVLDLAWRRHSSESAFLWCNALQLPKEDITGAVWLLRAPEASAVVRMCVAEPHRTITAILPG